MSRRDTSSPVPLCRHCQRCRATRARGLCGTCYEDPVILNQYPPQSVGKSGATSPRPMCRHCHKRRAYRARGLCYTCYNDAAIRDTYGPAGGSAGGGDFYGSPPLPEPTDALPGLPEKVRVLEERASLGQQLWHPEDATGLEELPGRDWTGELLELLTK